MKKTLISLALLASMAQATTDDCTIALKESSKYMNRYVVASEYGLELSRFEKDMLIKYSLRVISDCKDTLSNDSMNDAKKLLKRFVKEFN